MPFIFGQVIIHKTESKAIFFLRRGCEPQVGPLDMSQEPQDVRNEGFQSLDMYAKILHFQKGAQSPGSLPGKGIE